MSIASKITARLTRIRLRARGRRLQCSGTSNTVLFNCHSYRTLQQAERHNQPMCFLDLHEYAFKSRKRSTIYQNEVTRLEEGPRFNSDARRDKTLDGEQFFPVDHCGFVADAYNADHTRNH